MYEHATVLDYDNRKIWIKKIGNGLYLINGCTISCNDMDRLSVEKVARAIDKCYTPLFDFDLSKDILSYCVNPRNAQRTLAVYHIADNIDIIDMDTLTASRNEYDAWMQSVPCDLIYVNDCRGMGIENYMITHFDKVDNRG